MLALGSASWCQHPAQQSAFSLFGTTQLGTAQLDTAWLGTAQFDTPSHSYSVGVFPPTA